MNRRTFLYGLGKFMGAAAIAATAPKFIFDVGKNLHVVDKTVVLFQVNPEYKDAPYQEIIIETGGSCIVSPAFDGVPTLVSRSGVSLKAVPMLYPRRFTSDENGNLVEVLPFKV